MAQMFKEDERSFQISIGMKEIGCLPPGMGGGGGTLHNGLYGKAPPERGTFFRLEVYKRVGISRVLSIGKGWENCHLGIKRDFQNTSNRRT